MSKKSPRHLSRSIAAQAIYYFKLNPSDISAIKEFLETLENPLYTKADQGLMHDLIEQATLHFDEMLNNYNPYLQRELSEINLMEQVILVIAAIEIINNLSVPAPVIINEAIELAKLYGSLDSHKFINNLVDKLAKQLRSAEIQHYSKK